MSAEKKETPVISKEKLLEAIKDLLKQQQLEQESLKRDKRARGGLAKGSKEMGGLLKGVTAGITTGLNYRNAIDKPYYSIEKKEIPTVKETIISIRKSLANGGSASDEDIGQTLYLIEILENASGLRPDEAMLLEGLYEDLKRMTGSK